MSFSLLTSYPWYFIVFCLLAGAGIAYLTYRKNDAGTGEKWYSWPVWLMLALRFLSVSILTFLLLSPVVKSLFKKTEEPVIILAADNSQSVLLNKDSSAYKTNLSAELEKLKAELEKEYDVRTYTFGKDIEEGLALDYSGKQTNLSGLYDYLYNTYYNQNVGAVITLTDGIYNQGMNPAYTAEKINAPFYMVALGDTIPQRDVIIRNVRYNQVVYSGNDFPLEVQLKSKGYKGKTVSIAVSNKGKVLSAKKQPIDQDIFFTEIPFSINASAPGLQHYHIEVSHLDNEISYVNNGYDVFIDVIDSKKKILIIARSPHPDVAAVKNSIERNAFYEVSAYTYDEFQKANIGAQQLKNYQLVILHQLPGTGISSTSLINNINEAGLSTLYIVGNQSDLNVFNTLSAGLDIQGSAARQNEVSGYLNEQFSLFEMDREIEDEMRLWPPMFSPFGDFSRFDKDKVLLYQSIGKVKTLMPLLTFSQADNRKTGVLAAEGIWRWFLYDYADNQNNELTDALINKTIQYLSLKSDSRLFRVRPGKNIFYEDEKILFEAEVYNPSYEPEKNAQISMQLKNSDGKTFDFNFQPKGKAYFLDAGYLPAGNYSYKAQTRTGGKAYQLEGEFIIKKVELEYLETQANHSLLYTIAKQQGGEMLLPADIQKIPELLQAREDVQTVSYMQTEFKNLIEFKWLFALLFVLLAGEWFMRKYYGTI